ncbi:MAG TPA: OsmC family protein [Nevskiaceae bacterium]|nr:OsmC family protein [Nevskiaceae bacterium]
MIEVRKAPEGRLKQQIRQGEKTWFADVSATLGGEDAGPDPHDLLDSALGACTALTVTMVARRKQMPLEDVRVEIRHIETEGLYRLERQIELVGPLTPEQRQYLLGIANKCPIHKVMQGRFEVETQLREA